MRRLLTSLRFRSSMALMVSGVVLLLGALPVLATVPGDVAAGLPADKIVANGLGAGMTLEAIMTQALDAGAKAEPMFKAGIAQGADLSSLFKLFMDKLKYDPNFRGECTLCDLMKWAKEAGKDPVEIANAVMAAGGDLNDVRNCLASMGVPGAETYAYSPPGPPGGAVGVGPTFPGSGGGGGGVASPSM